MSNKPLTDERLAEIRNRCDAATPGPWHVEGDEWWWRVVTRDGSLDVYSRRVVNAEQNAEFVANARTDVPVLLDEVDRLRRELAEMQQVVHDLTSPEGDAAGSAAYQRGVSDEYARCQRFIRRLKYLGSAMANLCCEVTREYLGATDTERGLADLLQRKWKKALRDEEAGRQ